MIKDIIILGVGITIGAIWPVFFRNEAVKVATFFKGKPKTPPTNP